MSSRRGASSQKQFAISLNRLLTGSGTVKVTLCGVKEECAAAEGAQKQEEGSNMTTYVLYVPEIHKANNQIACFLLIDVCCRIVFKWE